MPFSPKMHQYTLRNTAAICAKNTLSLLQDVGASNGQGAGEAAGFSCHVKGFVGKGARGLMGAELCLCVLHSLAPIADGS